MPDGRAIAFIGKNEKRVSGVFVQDFRPGQDTSKFQRELGGFDPDFEAESFGISPDGLHLTIAYKEPLRSLMLAEGVPGISPPKKGAR